MQNKGIGIAHLPNQRYRSFCKKGLNYNIMIIGGSGVGKSTFINNLFRTELMPKSLDAYTLSTSGTNNLQNANDLQNTTDLNNANDLQNANDQQNTTDLQNENYQQNTIDLQSALATFLITDAHFIDKKFNINIKIVEVDNVGDQINNTGCWLTITQYLHSMYKEYYLKEKQMVKSMILDNRVHLCLYFVESYGEPLRPVDTKILSEISSMCNVVLVVGKSDILTNDEKAVFHDEIVKKLTDNNITLFEPKEGEIMIFFIASARKSVTSIDEGDLNELQELIIQKGMIDLIEQTETYYEAFRTKELTRDLEGVKFDVEEVQVSNEFIEMMNKEEKRIDEARLEYIRKRNEYEERIREVEQSNEEY